MKRYLFSYGTLLPELAPEEIASTVRRFRPVGRGRVRGWLYDLGGYPGAILSDAGRAIEGQVFQLPDDPEVLKRLDEYEEFDPGNPEGSLFVRKECSVDLDQAKKVPCWVYEYNRHPGSAASLLNGDFAKSRTQKSR